MKFIRLFLILTVILDQVCVQNSHALGVSGYENPLVKRAILAEFERSRILLAETPFHKKLLEENGADCLRLCSGKYLVSKDIAKSDLALLAGEIRCEMRAYMDIIEEDDPRLYSEIKKFAIGNLLTDREKELAGNERVNDILSEIFTYLYLLDEGVLAEGDVPGDKLDYLKEITAIAKEHKEVFAKEFSSIVQRRKKIHTAVLGGKVFYSMAGIARPNREELYSLSSAEEKARYVSNLYKTQKAEHKRSIRKIISYEDLLTEKFLETLKGKTTEKWADRKPAIIGISGSPAAGKTTISKRIKKILKRYLNKKIVVINFDDWLLQSSDREMDPATGKTTEKVLKKFQVEKFVKSMKLFAEGQDLLKPIYDQTVKGRLKIGLDEDGGIMVHLGSDFYAKVEKEGSRSKLVGYRKGEGVVAEGAGINLGDTNILLLPSKNGTTYLEVFNTIYRIGHLSDGKRDIQVLDKDFNPVKSMIDPENGDVVASAKAVLAKGGHYDERGRFTDKPWDAKEYITARGDAVHIVEGILSLYDLPDVANGQRLSSKYVSSIFIDADYDVRLTRGILRMKERWREAKGKEPGDEEIMNYAYQFWLRQREEELVISESADRSNAVRVSNQTRAEDIFVLFKDGELMLPRNLDIFREMDVLPYRSQRRLEEKGEQWIKEYLHKHFAGGSFANVKQRKSGSSFEVFFIGGGLVLKVYKKPRKFDENEAEFFQKVLKRRAGGLLVPGIILDISDLNITETIAGRKRKLGRVLIQNTGESFDERVNALLKEGNIKKAEKLIDEFFELQKKMWSVGIIDKDPQIMKEYGIIIDNGREKLVAFVSNSMSNNPSDYAPANYDKDEEAIPPVLKEYYIKRKGETVVSKEKFISDIFEKDLINAEPLQDISHSEVNYQQLSHMITLMAERKVALLEKCFNDAGVKGKLAIVVWIKAFVESILRMNIPEDTRLCENLEELAISFVENPEILDKLQPKDIKRIISDHVPAYETAKKKQIDMFVKALYRIHRRNKKKADIRTDMENLLASDRMLMNILMEDLLCGTTLTADPKIYRLKYDVSKLSDIQVKILRTYAAMLEGKLARGSAIRLQPFSSSPGDLDGPVISVEYMTKGGELKGRGDVRVTLPEGASMENCLLNITGMVNLAFTVSNIPAGTPRDEMEEECGYILGFIRNQYKFITGEDLGIDICAPRDKSMPGISILLKLPVAAKRPLSYLTEYYEATLKALIAA